MADNKIETFWNVIDNKKKDDEEKKVIAFNLEKYLDWMQEQGFFRKDNGAGNFILVRIVDNVVSEVYKHTISKFILDYFKSLPDKFDGITRTKMINWYGNNYRKMSSEAIFDLLETRNICFYRDNMSNAKVFFSNGIVCIGTGGTKIISYKEFDGVIWHEQIIQRNIVLSDIKAKGDFEKFMTNIFGGDKTNINSVRTAIGYLLHNYKPTSYAPAIVLNDKVISENADGGTGKGIFAKAIGQFKNSVTLDGKSFDFNKSFVFQRVEQFTNLLVFDDVKRDFSFENLFSVITEGITVEKKNKGEFFIPFEHSPKILITTNYALKGYGNSIERRKIDFELEQFYTRESTPYDEFKRMFFSEWDSTEWAIFDNFMLGCIELYIKKGLMLPKNENLAEKRLSANTNPDFIDFMTEYNDFGVVITKQKFLHDIIDSCNLKNLTSHKLTKWIKEYADFYGYEVVEGRTSNERTIKIGLTSAEKEIKRLQDIKDAQLKIKHQYETTKN